MAITNLTNTKWYLNDTLEPMGEYIESGWFGPGYSTHYTINFTANDVAFCELGCEFFESPASGASDRIGELQYKYVNPEGLDPCELPYDYLSSQWYAYAEPYRTITITGGDDVTNSDLITWLEANATQLSIDDTGGIPDNTPDDDGLPPNMGTIISYNGNIIATVQSGEIATLECVGMKMEGNIVVEAPEESGSTLKKFDGTVVVE